MLIVNIAIKVVFEIKIPELLVKFPGFSDIL